MARMHLELLRFTVLAEATDASQAVNLFRTARPEVMVLDTALPSRDGIDSRQLLAVVRNEAPTTTVVVIATDMTDPIAANLDPRAVRNLLLDPGDRRGFQRMWRALAAIYPEIMQPEG
jgi:DNA-binding NarL/FixJ family response regulator